MVFSLFGRKDRAKNDSRGDTRVRRGADGRPDESPSEVARQMAAKIDQIEAEMIAGGAVPPASTPLRPAPVAAPQPAPAVAAQSVPGGQAVAVIEEAAPAQNTVSMLGDTQAAGRIEVNESALPSDLEEAAILYANGQSQHAAQTLRHVIAGHTLGAFTQQAWLMLFDVYQGAGAKADFEALAVGYASKYERSPPMWHASLATAMPDGRTASVAQVVMPQRLDGDIIKQLEQVQRAANNRRPVMIDFSSARTIDANGAALLQRMIETFKKSKREMSIAGVDTLRNLASASIQAGRRDPSDACWLLALETLRLTDEKQRFEDLSIDYCVTFEVSPPSWESMPPWIRAQSDAASTLLVEEAMSNVEGNLFVLRGELSGRIADEIAALRKYAESRNDVMVDCRLLTRLEFVAAGELLNEIAALSGAGKKVVFVEPNYIVHALMIVMGLHELADFRRRKI